ncbi:FAD-binding domain-containing protein [Pleurostoma richardsiae]|uniref:FAD-binding domain-containing protein n=1 Tax=Pleurostoma richardsiae TaxID=41990 RepID=A0AA38S4U8_9PEZI|nr:FAD-binding domain-containing protein [Pleurostoma richardsiae]
MYPLVLLVGYILGLLPCVRAKTAWQYRNYTFAVPETPVASFSCDNYTSKSDALTALAAALGNDSIIAYAGDVNYGSTIARVWTKQRQTWPDAIVYPETTEQVSTLMQFYSGQHALWSDEGFAIMGGGHADFGGAQSHSVIVDLQKLGATEIVTNSTSKASSDPAQWAILKVGGGAEAGQVYSALEGTGWAFLGPRAASIGVGGFLLGGGIAFQTNHYGVASDSIVGAEIVLVNGTIVYANPENEYSDLFWAITGGGWLGYGVVTHFYVRAYPDPGNAYVGTIVWGEDHADSVFERAADWWTSNNNPDAFPALIFYFKDPENPTALVPIKERQYVFQLNALYFGGDETQFNETFGQFYDGASSVTFANYSIETLDQYLLTNYPYGYNREFYGKSHTNSTEAFYQQVWGDYKEIIQGLLARGEDPGHTMWVDEYILPTWGGFGPEWDSQTAWPHSTSAHITLTSGEWSNDTNTAFMHAEDKKIMGYLRDFQNSYIDTPAIYDYPNYIAPHSVTEEVWGAENFKRLVGIKAKYDPQCLLNRGRVPDTQACVAKGLANTSTQ